MFFLKKAILGIGALVLIMLGGAGTQSQSTLLQGGGFLGLIIGLIVLYIFAKMAWRAMGCLPSILAITAIVVFILYAIGGFNNGIGGVGGALQSFLGQSNATTKQQFSQVNAGSINLLEDENFDAPIGESFSAPKGKAAPVKQQAPAPQEQSPEQSGGLFQKVMGAIGGAPTTSSGNAMNPDNFPAIYEPVTVASGDTLIVSGRYLRLYGVDAPENNQSCSDASGRSYKCGRQAFAWLSGWLQDNPVECRIMQQDAKGNMVGTCSLGDYDLGAALVNAGWAVSYVKYTDIYMPYQIQAQENARGLWQGEFYMPWDWRTLQNRKPNIKIIKQKPKRSRVLLGSFG